MSIWKKENGAEYEDIELESEIALRLKADFIRICKLLYAAEQKLGLREDISDEPGPWALTRPGAALTANRQIILSANPSSPKTDWMKEKFGLDLPPFAYREEIAVNSPFTYWALLDYELRLLIAEHQSRHCDDCEILSDIFNRNWNPHLLEMDWRNFL